MSLWDVAIVIASAAAATVVVVGFSSWVANHAWWKPALAIASLLALSAAVAVGQVDKLLMAMHPTGTPDRGMGAVAGTLFAAPDPDAMRGVVGGWLSWFGSAGPVLSPLRAARWYLALDSFFLIPAYTSAIVIAVSRLRKRLTTTVETMSATPGAVHPQLGVVHSQLGVSRYLFWVIPALPFVNWLENRMLGSFVQQVHPSNAFSLLLHYLTVVKFGLIILIVGFALPPVLGLLKTPGTPYKAFGITIGRLRAQIVLVIVYALIVLLPLQVPDVIRRWHASQAIAAVGTGILFALLIWTFSRSVLAARASPKARAPRRRSLLIAGLVLLAVGAVSFGLTVGPKGLLVPGIGFLLMWLLDGAGGQATWAPGSPPTVGMDATPRFLAAAVLAVLGLAALRAFLGETIYANTALALWVLLGWGIVAPLVAVGFSYFLRWRAERESSAQTGGLLRRIFNGRNGVGISVVIAIATYVWVSVDVWGISQAVGAVTMVTIWLMLAAIVTGFVSILAETTVPPKALWIVGVRRMPVYAMLGVWFLVEGMLGSVIGRPDFHDARWLAADPAPGAELGTGPSGDVTFSDVWARWISNNEAPLGSSSTAQARPTVPMVFVATAGGGVKAAAWTTMVLDCAFSPAPPTPCKGERPDASDRWASVFAGSGASGGSVGLVTFMVHEVHPDLVASDDPRGWSHAALGEDFVSPSLTWQLYVEAPETLLRIGAGADRAEIIEQAWERAWQQHLSAGGRSEDPLQQGFLELWRSDPTVPLMLLNGTSVQDGCKLVTSPLSTNGGLTSRNCLSVQNLREAGVDTDPNEGQIFPAVRDLTDFICTDDDPPRQDVRISTAALLSARFPYVSPSGRLPICGSSSGAINVVDGGYFDNSGASSIVELWPDVRREVEMWNASTDGPCIVPYLIQIESGYGPSAEQLTGTPSELAVPPKTLFGTPSAHTVGTRENAGLAFREPLDGVTLASSDGQTITDRYAFITPHAHPGIEAPLGWTLSDDSFDELMSQLELNQTGFDEIASWFSGDVTCTPAT
jgi:hypothetical protein